MNRGSRLALAALGALVSLSISPVSAQVVVGESRSSVDVNWDVLDRLGPEPTLPGLITRPPAAAAVAPARPVARPVAKAPVTPKSTAAFKPYAPAEPPAKVVKAPKPAAVVEAAPAVPAPARIATPAPAKVEPVVEDKPKSTAAAPARPVKPDVAVDVPLPPKPVAEPKPKSSVATPPAPEPAKVEAPKAPEPVKVVEAPKAPEPPKVVEAPKVEAPKVEAPAVQFVSKAPTPIAPTPVVPAPAPVAAAPVPVAPPLPVAPPVPVVAAPPPPAPVVVPAPAPQLAAVPPVSVSRKGDSLTVSFGTDSSHLPDSIRPELERLAQRMDKDETLSMQLLAYAAGDEANASKARRLSLSRALEVRKYLMEMGVRSTRIEVRALGNKVESGPPDRVDAQLVAR